MSGFCLEKSLRGTDWQNTSVNKNGKYPLIVVLSLSVNKSRLARMDIQMRVINRLKERFSDSILWKAGARRI
jgi:hypothetical protein